MKGPAERLPREVFSVAAVRELDRRAIAELGVPGYELMTRAAATALDVLRRRWPSAQTIVVVTGAGNNGGDGYVLARLARAAGLAARVLAVVPRERLKGDAARAAEECAAAGVAIEPFAAAEVASGDVVVDALLGTGLERPVEGVFRAAIDAVNAAARPVLALDVPSGLDADTGWRHGCGVRASATVSFVALKQGLFLGEAADYTGEIELAPLGLPAALVASAEPRLLRLTGEVLDRALPPRSRAAHKGTNGRLLLIGGGPGMAGAIRLAAEAALRVGAGLVYVATHADNAAAVLAGRPEIICRGVARAADLDELLGAVDAIVVGPGLGRTPWAEALCARALDTLVPVVADADALNALADEPRARANWVLTPHPGEAARLLGYDSAAAVQRDRAAAARSLADRYGAEIVLKGVHSLVAAPRRTCLHVCDRGNPGMATAGMGDVLAGVIGGLVAQTRELDISVEAGVLLHALAGDAAAADGERGTVAGDLFPHLRKWANRG